MTSCDRAVDPVHRVGELEEVSRALLVWTERLVEWPPQDLGPVAWRNLHQVQEEARKLLKELRTL